MLFAEKPLWRTGYSYVGDPAVRADRLYGGRSSSPTTTFAVDLTKNDFPVVWKTSFGGSLAITPEGI